MESSNSSFSSWRREIFSRRASLKLLIGYSHAVLMNLVDYAKQFGFFGTHVLVTLELSANLLNVLACVLGQYLHQHVIEAHHFLVLDCNIRGCALLPALHVMHHDPRVRERETLALSTCGKQKAPHTGGLPYTNRNDVRLDVAHSIVNPQTGGYHSAGRVDVHVNVLLGIVTLKKEELSDNSISHCIVDAGSDENDTIL